MLFFNNQSLKLAFSLITDNYLCRVGKSFMKINQDIRRVIIRCIKSVCNEENLIVELSNFIL